jgi:peptidoglycan hydrolase CwlO-like protein
MKETGSILALLIIVTIIPVYGISVNNENVASNLKLTSEQNQKLGDIQNRLNELVNSLNTKNYKLKRFKKLITRLNQRIANFNTNPMEPVDEIINRLAKRVEKLEFRVTSKN